MKIKTLYGNGLYAYGDSITVGQLASTTALSYVGKLGAYLGGSVSNQGVSGTGTCEAAKRAVTQPKTRTASISVLAGLNDVRRYGVSAIPMIKANIRAIIHAGLAGDCVDGYHISKTGTWTTLSSTWGGRGRSLPAGAAVYSSDSSALMTWTFSGTNCLVGSIATPTSNGDLIINVDGTDYDLPVTGVTLESYAYPSLLISGLADTSHTLTIRPKSSGTTIYVDYVGVLATSSAPIFIGEIPYLTSLTYNGNTITLANIDTVNSAIESVVNEFAGFNVAYVDTNYFYNVATGIASDGIHWNNTGHDQGFNAFKDSISLYENITLPVGTTQVVLNDGTEHCYNTPVTLQAFR